MLVNCCKALSLPLLASMVWSWSKLWDVKTLKLLYDGCNRDRCVGYFYLYLAAISGHIAALHVYGCLLEYLLQTSEVLRIFLEAPTPGGSENFLGGSELC
jgi:hypothetical protein